MLMLIVFSRLLFVCVEDDGLFGCVESLFVIFMLMFMFFCCLMRGRRLLFVVLVGFLCRWV